MLIKGTRRSCIGEFPVRILFCFLVVLFDSSFAERPSSPGSVCFRSASHWQYSNPKKQLDPFGICIP